MRAAGFIVGGILCVSGIVWMLQGMGSQFVPESFMTNSSRWIVIGAITAAVGLATLRWNWVRR